MDSNRKPRKSTFLATSLPTGPTDHSATPLDGNVDGATVFMPYKAYVCYLLSGYLRWQGDQVFAHSHIPRHLFLAASHWSAPFGQLGQGLHALVKSVTLISCCTPFSLRDTAYLNERHLLLGLLPVSPLLCQILPCPKLHKLRHGSQMATPRLQWQW
jgi:hypothetical protein